jgi:hypothetical protein
VWDELEVKINKAGVCSNNEEGKEGTNWRMTVEDETLR